MAEIKHVAAIAELMNDDGTMMNYDDCCIFSKENNINIVTMKELIDHIKLETINKRIIRVIRVIASCELNIHKYGL